MADITRKQIGKMEGRTAGEQAIAIEEDCASEFGRRNADTVLAFNERQGNLPRSFVSDPNVCELARREAFPRMRSQTDEEVAR